jgi:uncharacterized protein (TIRG00374 family)
VTILKEAVVSSETRMTAAAMDESPLFSTSSPRRRPARSWTVRIAALATALALVVFFRDALPDPAAMVALAADADPGWLAIVVMAEILSMGAFARLQRRLLRTGGVRISLPRAFAVTYAGNALSTTLPAGPAISAVYSFRQFRRGGASAQVATAVILLGGIATSTAYTVVALLTLLGEPESRLPAGVALLSAAAGGVLLWWSAGFRRGLRGITGHVLGAALRHRRAARLARSVQRAHGVMRFSRRDLGAVIAFAVLNWTFEAVALIAATRALGISLAPHEVMLAYFAAQAAGSLLPLLPGGLGAVEAGLVTTLVAFGASALPAGAAVAVYRLVSLWAVVAVGWLAWLLLRASDQSLHAAQRRLAAASASAVAAFAAAAGMTGAEWGAAPCAGVPSGPCDNPPPG